MFNHNVNRNFGRLNALSYNYSLWRTFESNVCPSLSISKVNTETETERDVILLAFTADEDEIAYSIVWSSHYELCNVK